MQDDVLTRPGVPVLDLLNGDALNADGGQSRHEIEAQAGIAKRGRGGNVTLNWRSGTVGRNFGTVGDLSFGGYVTVSANLFANIASVFGTNASGWIKGLRANSTVQNLFNSRQTVRDAAGSTPISYKPTYLDPLGGTIALSLRKVF